MPVGIKTPVNQIKLTNVSLVRMKRGKKRFEIACYKNKVLEWRSGVEKDLDNVLQIPNVFINVSKGQVANKEDLAKGFGKDRPLDDIILEILNKGELQVGEKERNAQLERVHNEVVDIVAGRLVDPKTKRVYTTGMIEKALDQLSSATAQAPAQHQHASGTSTPTTTTASSTAAAANNGADAPPPPKKDLPRWSGVTTNKSAKSQALEAMKALIAHQPIPVARARMRLRITCPTNILKQAVKSAPAPAPSAAPSNKGSGARGGNNNKKGASRNNDDDDDDDDADGEEQKAPGTVKDRILSLVEQIENQDVLGDEWECVGFVEPGAYRALTEFITTQTKGRARSEVLDMAVMHED
ncbi:SBDS protein C-terminal domain-containing protein [Phyllosticta citrichinensis]|uniref:SBDS protein C-terminal domain-containing protein n=1 Tax=Phyllosticta citrichinensis TaxID=1130410 RepID=A0ABR1Y810_9PEZI